MNRNTVPIFLFLASLAIISCDTQPQSTGDPFPAPDAPKWSINEDWPEGLTQDIYYDKILGMLVGSAIGDAMGAPVEMWSRKQMLVQYGYIDTLINVIREGSPEGPWEDNMLSGATTDDTRWKYLLGNFLLNQNPDSLDDRAFAQYIVELYQNEMAQVQEVRTFDPEPLERELRHMTWLQEWAKVAKPYGDDDLRGYSYALNRFYGGEMACAGMLYSPMIGGVFPGQEERAYSEAYRLGIFDIGYARDIMALTSAYVAKAMVPNVTYDEIVGLTLTTDPLRYSNSRLIGRLAYQSLTRAKEIVYETNQLELANIDEKTKLPRGYRGSKLEYAQLQKAFTLLDGSMKVIPFHAGEIHIINLTALEYSQGDFRKAMEFITNFGRDNDTVGAVTGAILGAYHGYDNLPEGLAVSVITTSREVVGIDLEQLAKQMTEKAFER